MASALTRRGPMWKKRSNIKLASGKLSNRSLCLTPDPISPQFPQAVYTVVFGSGLNESVIIKAHDSGAETYLLTLLITPSFIVGVIAQEFSYKSFLMLLRLFSILKHVGHINIVSRNSFICHVSSTSDLD